MVTLNLDLNTTQSLLIEKIDKEKLSFLVSKVFDEYLEELKDEELSKQINNSKELDNLLNNIKF